MARLLPALFSLLMLLAGCARPDAVAPPRPTDQPLQRCTNREHGFSVSYPAGWHTNDGDVFVPCSAFDPDPIAIPRDSEVPFDIAVVMDVEEISFERMADPTVWERILSAQRITVAGREAMRIESEATGEGLADRGMRSLRYVIDLGGGKSLIASTHDAAGTWERDKEVLARMMETLTLRVTSALCTFSTGSRCVLSSRSSTGCGESAKCRRDPQVRFLAMRASVATRSPSGANRGSSVCPRTKRA